MVIVKKHPVRASRRQILQCLAMALLGQMLTGIFLTASYMYISVAMATMINFLYPAIVCVIMSVGARKKLTLQQVAAIVFSITGMVFLTGAGGDISFTGILFALVSAFTYSGYLICGEVGPANDLPVNVKLMYIAAVSSACYAVLCTATGSFTLPHGAVSWLMLVGGSGMFSALGFFLMMYGIVKLGAITASFISILEPVVSVVFGTLWFHDPLTGSTVIGGLLLLASMLLATIKQADRSHISGELPRLKTHGDSPPRNHCNT